MCTRGARRGSRMSKSYARIFRFLFARLTLMLGSQMRQSRREGAPMTGDDEKEGAKRVEPARPSKKSTEEVLKRAGRPADPRQNMPSRFTGSFPAPRADRQPPLATTSSTAKPPAMNIQRGLK